MATPEEYAQWIVDNQDKQGTPEFETVAEAYRTARTKPVTPEAVPQPATREEVMKRFAKVEEPSLIDKGLAKLPDWLLTGNRQMRGVAQGAADPSIGLTQLGANLIGQGDSVNQFVKDKEAEYQANRKLQGGEGFDWSRLGGNLIAPTNVMAVSRLPKAANLLPKALNLPTLASSGMAQGLALGSLSGLSKPETSDDYWTDKVKSVAVDSALGLGLPFVGAAIKGAVTKVLPNLVSAWGTHTGAEPIVQAAKAGYQGGKALEQFTENMRGKANVEDVLDMARKNVADMGRKKSELYRSGIADISSDKSILGFTGVDEALSRAKDIISYKGQVKNERAAKVYQDVADEIGKWKSLDPKEFHTPEGLDALKQRVGAILEGIPFEEKTALKVGRDLYNAVKDEIVNQAPTYSKVMKDYSDASSLISEIEKGLSLGSRVSSDTALRKLQSIMRNNANTNYGQRMKLAQNLESSGANQLMPSLAGQALSSWSPRGLGGALGGAGAIGGYLVNPALGATIAASQSPRVVGEVAKGLGQLARYAGPLSHVPVVTAATSATNQKRK